MRRSHFLSSVHTEGKRAEQLLFSSCLNKSGLQSQVVLSTLSQHIWPMRSAENQIQYREHGISSSEKQADLNPTLVLNPWREIGFECELPVKLCSRDRGQMGECAHLSPIHNIIHTICELLAHTTNISHAYVDV